MRKLPPQGFPRKNNFYSGQPRLFVPSIAVIGGYMADRDWTKARVVSEPKVGFYKVRLTSKGWPVPAELRIHNGLWWATLDGDPLGCWLPEDFLLLSDATLAMRIHLYGEQIDGAEFYYLNALREFCKLHHPDHPAANPTRPINIRLQRVEEF